MRGGSASKWKWRGLKGGNICWSRLTNRKHATGYHSSRQWSDERLAPCVQLGCPTPTTSDALRCRWLGHPPRNEAARTPEARPYPCKRRAAGGNTCSPERTPRRGTSQSEHCCARRAHVVPPRTRQLRGQGLLGCFLGCSGGKASSDASSDAPGARPPRMLPALMEF